MVCWCKLLAYYPYVMSTVFAVSLYATLANVFLLRLSNFRSPHDDIFRRKVVEKDYLLSADYNHYCQHLNLINRTDSVDNQRNVTLVTQGSFSHLGALTELSQRYDGPISIAVYLESTEKLVDALRHLLLLHKCQTDIRKKVTLHLFYPLAFQDSNCADMLTRAKAKVGSDYGHCRTPLSSRKLFATLNEAHSAKESWYPVNVARNLAKRGSSTDFELVSDIELMPSPGAARRFSDFLLNREQATAIQQEVFVIPVFEVQHGVNLPANKQILHSMLGNGSAVSFHVHRTQFCHRIPYLNGWFLTRPRNPIGIYHTTRWLRPCWEPVFIGHKTVPFYDTRFKGYGKNKIQQVYELCRADYRFHILEDVFLVHRNISTLDVNEWTRIQPMIQHNNKIFSVFRRELDRKYSEQATKDYCDKYQD